MKIQTDENYPLSISKRFINILSTEIAKAGIETSAIENYVIINFRDPDYSADKGGYHPVEVMINADGIIQYITDFAYVGGQGELVKELDFDLNQKIFQQMGRDYPIEHGRGLYRIFQSNFCSYYESGAFEVTASSF
jgi:hypothetical protein